MPIFEAARIKPTVVQVEADPYLPETELVEFCKKNDIVFLAFAPSLAAEDALDEINRIQTRLRFKEVMKTGSPGLIPEGR